MTEAVIAAECFDKILISTDDDRIFDAVSDLKVIRHSRPKHHATVEATVLDAMMNLMEELERFEYATDSYQDYEIFSYFLPTCPFVDSTDIRKGVSLLSNGLADSVVSMTQIPETVQLACLMNGDSVLPIFDNLECGLTNSKFIKKYFKPSGAFYMGWWDSIKQNKNFFKGDVKGVVIPAERSVDINTIEDIKYAESNR